jgi:hypothetical protein
VILGAFAHGGKNGKILFRPGAKKEINPERWFVSLYSDISYVRWLLRAGGVKMGVVFLGN